MPVSKSQEYRSVGFWLFLGILLMPLVFAWFTLRDGYFRTARIVSLGWMSWVVMVALFAFIHQPTQAEKVAHEQEDAHQEIGLNSAVAIEMAQKAMRQRLKDPDSAQFRNVTVTRVLNADPNAFNAVVCGFVNSKNSFGGFAGYKGFVVKEQTVYAEELEGVSFARTWNRECLKIPTKAAPTGFRGLRWGARVPSSLVPISPGAAVYVRRDHKVPPYLGIIAAEQDFTFDKGGLFGGDVYFSGTEKFGQLHSALMSEFGEASDAVPRLYKWTWPNQHIIVQLFYETRFARTTVRIAKTE